MTYEQDTQTYYYDFPPGFDKEIQVQLDKEEEIEVPVYAGDGRIVTEHA